MISNHRHPRLSFQERFETLAPCAFLSDVRVGLPSNPVTHFPPLGILEPSNKKKDQIEQKPDPEAAEAEQLNLGGPGFADIESVHAKYPETDTLDQGDGSDLSAAGRHGPSGLAPGTARLRCV